MSQPSEVQLYFTFPLNSQLTIYSVQICDLTVMYSTTEKKERMEVLTRGEGVLWICVLKWFKLLVWIRATTVIKFLKGAQFLANFADVKLYFQGSFANVVKLYIFSQCLRNVTNVFSPFMLNNYKIHSK